MMKNLALEFQHVEPEILENEIQGLYSPKDACQSFWSLLSKVELAVFQDQKKR